MMNRERWFFIWLLLILSACAIEFMRKCEADITISRNVPKIAGILEDSFLLQTEQAPCNK